ncbi:hypothetical protein [Enhygromyxa salina]|uniref:Uncharacterized protein n=1 Tax=Enhygromyxa salina TaxID=215803 RepID=A0A2S9XQM9_9BACT|nr:hypothetical protein [Enhygromyxa salina]PRP95162.1 hypothetical protein ENSA7_74760 [Enhygromyxa salina]
MVEPKFRVPPAGGYWPHTWVVVGDVIISLTQEGQVQDDLWDLFIQDIEKRSTERMLGIGIGAININSRQRRKLVQAMHDKRVAAVLGSSVARGIATALGWMGLKIRGFGWDDMPGAFEYLGSEQVVIDDAVEVVTQLLARAGAPTIEELAAS